MRHIRLKLVRNLSSSFFLLKEARKILFFCSNFFFKMKILIRSHYSEFHGASFCQDSFLIIMHYIPEITGKVLKKYFLVAKTHYNGKIIFSLSLLLQVSKKISGHIQLGLLYRTAKTSSRKLCLKKIFKY